MNAAEAAKEHLRRFCKDEDQRVCAFKGPWGVGKSYLVRNLVREGDAQLPEYISYVSVFGLGTIREVQDRIIGCIERRRSSLGNIVAKAAAKSLSVLSNAKVAVPFVPLQLPDFSTAAFWHIAKTAGLLIVLDDLERANPSLQLDQLLGLVSSIAENSAAKFLLVFNEEELPGEGPKTLARFREKVIDSEFTYRPSVADLVAEYLDEEILSQTVISCLEAKGGPNIRLIQRINRGVRIFRETMVRLNIPTDDAILIQMAKIIWHFHVSPIPLTEESTLSMGLWEEPTDDEKEANQLARQVGLGSTPFDGLMLGYLNHGHFSDDSLRGFSEEQAAKRRKAELQSKVDAVVHLYDENFLSSEDAISAAIERLMQAHCRELSLSQMRMLTIFLDDFEQPSAPWWRQHVNAAAAFLTADGCKAYLPLLTDPEARQVIQSRLDTLVEPFDPGAVILKIGRNQGWRCDDLHKLNTVDASVYKDWLQKADGDLIAPLQGFMEQFANAAVGTPEWQIHKKIADALTEMSGENKANHLRVKHLFRLPASQPP